MGDCIMTAKKYYRVRTDTNYKTSDHLQHGYEEERDYRRALRRLQIRFGGRTGQSIDTRGNLTLVRFCDTPDNFADEVWFPSFLLFKTSPPNILPRKKENDVVDEIFWPKDE